MRVNGDELYPRPIHSSPLIPNYRLITGTLQFERLQLQNFVLTGHPKGHMPLGTNGDEWG